TTRPCGTVACFRRGARAHTCSRAGRPGAAAPSRTLAACSGTASRTGRRRSRLRRAGGPDALDDLPVAGLTLGARGRSVIPAGEPDQVLLVLEAGAEIAAEPGAHLARVAGRSELLPPAFLAAAEAEVVRRDQDGDAVRRGAIDERRRAIEVRVVRGGEVAGPDEGLLTGAIRRRRGARRRRVVVVHQHHLDQVEALRAPVGEVVLLLGGGEIDEREPRRLALDQERGAA